MKTFFVTSNNLLLAICLYTWGGTTVTSAPESNLNWKIRPFSLNVASHGCDSTFSITISPKNKSFETTSPEITSSTGFSILFLHARCQCPFLKHFRQFDSFAGQLFGGCFGQTSMTFFFVLIFLSPISCFPLVASHNLPFHSCSNTVHRLSFGL